MNTTLARTFVVGFGMETGAIIAMLLWPEVTWAAGPLVCVGAGMMAFSLMYPSK